MVLAKGWSLQAIGWSRLSAAITPLRQAGTGLDDHEAASSL